MRNAWGLFAFVLLVGCGNKRDEPAHRARIVREEEIAPLVQPEPPRQPDIAIDDVPAVAVAPNDPPPTTQADPKPSCVDEAPVVSFDPIKLRACFDANDDGQADRCVTWRRDGKVQSIDTEFAVEDVNAPEEVAAPVEYRSDLDNNDDERISLDGTVVDICPFDRACMKIMPRVGDGAIQTVLTDPDLKRGVFVLHEEDKGTLEFWDLVAGRLRLRAALKRLVADETYDFSGHLGGNVVVVLANDGNGRALGAIYGLDGAFRGELAQGSRNLDVDKTFQHGGVFGIVDVGPIDADAKPYVLYLHSLASGAAIGKFTIKREGEGDLTFHALPTGFVAAAQWGEQLRIDMIDLRTRTNRVLFAPSC